MSTEKFPPYIKYQESGIEWIGRIPTEWDLWKLSHAFGEIGSGTTPPSDSSEWYGGGVLWVTTGELRERKIFETKKTVTASAMKKFSALRVYPRESIVIAMYGATIGRLGVLGVEATTNQACCVLPSSRFIDNTYLYYWFQAFRDDIVNLASGGGQPNISQAVVSSLRISAPPLPEQTQIAKFLDYETAKIDALIAKQQQLIALLQEKRQAVISHAVTKGLNPAAPLRDSGVEWLGKVPAHWTVSQLKYNTSQMQTGPFGSQLHAEDYIQGGIPLVNPIHIINGRIIPDSNCSVDSKTYERLARHKLSTGDIIFARRGELGRCAVVREEQDGWLCGSGSLRATLLDRLSPEYAFVLISSSGVRSELALESRGSTMDNLNTDTLGRVRLPVPPLDEQMAILRHIEQVSGQFDKLEKLAVSQSDLLQERRTALISAAVTGKIDVRGWQPPLANHVRRTAHTMHR